MRDLRTDLQRANFAHALHNPDIDQAHLALVVTQAEQRRRRELALAAMPEPDARDIAAAALLARIGR